MINILKPAQIELDQGFIFYENQFSGLGFEFIEDFEKAVKRIEQFPKAWHPFSKNTRRCLFSRFSYEIVYHLTDSTIDILAVAHLHRAPNYWVSRLKGHK